MAFAGTGSAAAGLAAAVEVFGLNREFPMRCHSVAYWYGEPNAVSNAINYAKFYTRSHDAVIGVYDHSPYSRWQRGNGGTPGESHLVSGIRQDHSKRVMFEPPPGTGLDVTKNWALAFSPGNIIVATWWLYLETLSTPVVASYCAVVPFGSRFVKFNMSPE